MLSRAVQQARYFGNVPEESQNYDIRNVRFLVRICYQLQKVTDSEPFYLSWKQAGRVLSVSPSCAGSYLRILIEGQILAIAEEHTDTEATKYRYTGNSMNESEGVNYE